MDSTEISADVQVERQRIATEALTYGQRYGIGTQVRTALAAVGLGDQLPRETAEVQVHVTGTVTVRCEPDGSWTQDAALRALQSAVWQGRAVIEATEVEATGAPEADEVPADEPTVALS